MKIYNIFKTITAAALGLSLLTACSGNSGNSAAPSGENGLRTLRVANMTGQPDQYADFIGQQQGIFEKHGISLQTTEFVAGINTVDSIVTGTADTGLLADFAAVNRFGNTLEATNLVIFSDLSSSTTTSGGIYVAPEYADDLSKLADSAGWITNIGTVAEYYNWQAQTYLGLDPDMQKVVQASDSSTTLALVQNGGASAIVASGSQAEKVEEYGWVKAADAKDVNIHISAYLITTKDFAAANTDLLADYLTALDESVQYLNDHLDESAKAIAERFGVDEEIFKSNWAQYNIKFGLSEEGAANLDNVNAWAFEHGKFPTEYNIRQFYFKDAAEKAFPGNTDVDLSGVNQ